MKKNSKLENLFVLSHKITVYVPSTDNNNNTVKYIDNSKYVEDLSELMCKTFGGVTSTDAIGYWFSSVRGLEKEKNKMVFSYAENLEKIDIIIDWCENLKAELKQDAIALEIDNQMYFI